MHRRPLIALAVALVVPSLSLGLMAACGGPGSPTPPLMSTPMDATTGVDATTEAGPGFGDVTLPDAPPGFFDVGSIEDAGLNLESGFSLDGSFDGEFTDVGTGDATF